MSFYINKNNINAENNKNKKEKEKIMKIGSTRC